MYNVQNNTLTGHTTTYYTTQKSTQIMHLKSCHLKGSVFFNPPEISGFKLFDLWRCFGGKLWKIAAIVGVHSNKLEI